MQNSKLFGLTRGNYTTAISLYALPLIKQALRLQNAKFSFYVITRHPQGGEGNPPVNSYIAQNYMEIPIALLKQVGE
ncbi:MAG: hypothetical protein II976_02460 [Alistipes sp.]|nr:hypothetical protein [Alistipes sp.]